MTEVMLAFPPLVETSFQNLYPSTAVLAAYLEPRGHQVMQRDLNRAFLDYILRRDELDASADRMYERSTSLSVAASSWVRRALADGSLEPAEIVATREEAGRPIDSVARHLVTPYSVDPDRSVVDGTFSDRALALTYEQFFREQLRGDLADRDGRFVVGISVPMGPQLMPALSLAAAVRSIASESSCRIILGGPTLSLLQDDVLALLLDAHRAVDCVVRFDGELPLLDLVGQVEDGRWEPWTVPGVSARTADNDVRHVPPARGPDLNELPTPSYSGDMIDQAPTTALAVLQARGCYWGKCDYCDFVETYKGSPSYRGRKAELVVEDIQALVAQTGVRRYRLITESIPAAFARRFARLIGDRSLDIRWSSFAMVDKRFDTALLRQMSESGCEFLVIGLESMTTSALEMVHKSADREENIRFLTDAHDAGITLSVNLIPDLPSTTYEQAIAGLRDLEQLAACVAHVKIFEFEVTRSSKVGRAPEAFGLERVERAGRRRHAQLAVNTIQVNDPAMTEAERVAVLRQYRDFAATVNAAHAPPPPTFAGAGFSRAYSQVITMPEGPLAIDFATMRQVQYPPRAVRAS